MKKKLLYFTLLFGALNVFGQTKSTGVVSLGANMTAELELDNGTTTATLTLTGPSVSWFAFRFGSFTSAMQASSDAGDAVYFNGTTLVDAKLFAMTSPANDASNDWTVSSNTTSGTTRTIIATRAFDTGDSNDYVFNYNDTDIDMAWAHGSGSFSISYHGVNKGKVFNNSFPLGTEEFAKVQVKVYPNPVVNSFSVQSDVELTSVKVYNVNGKLVLDKPVVDSDAQYSLAGLQNGVYFVEFDSPTGTLYEKIVKK